MTGTRRILHLIREPRIPEELAGSGDGDSLVFLSGAPEGPLPGALCYVLGAAVEGARGVDADGLADLVFGHDLVMTW